MGVGCGDLVVINTYREDEIPDFWNNDGLMNHLMGEVVRVTGVSQSDGGIWVYDEENMREWHFLPEHYTPYSPPAGVLTDEDLRNFIG